MQFGLTKIRPKNLGTCRMILKIQYVGHCKKRDILQRQQQHKKHTKILKTGLRNLKKNSIFHFRYRLEKRGISFYAHVHARIPSFTKYTTV